MTFNHFLITLLTVSLGLLFTPHSIGKSTVEQPQLQQALSYNPMQAQQSHTKEHNSLNDIRQYYVSEKLDGMRGYWNGKQLMSRTGNIITVPAWFTKKWPAVTMDGELWSGRNTFQSLMSCIKRQQTQREQKHSCWQHIRFMIFDLPDHNEPFAQRVIQMSKLVKQTKSPYLAMIPQELLPSLAELDNKLDAIIAKQGEGLMLHLASAHYRKGRTSALLKVKRHQDAEAIVVAYTPGKGKYAGMLGALKVRTANGVEFKIGSGLSDAERKQPPAIGTTITFKFNGYTKAGIPRFARFWRVRPAE